MLHIFPFARRQTDRQMCSSQYFDIEQNSKLASRGKNCSATRSRRPRPKFFRILFAIHTLIPNVLDTKLYARRQTDRHTDVLITILRYQANSKLASRGKNSSSARCTDSTAVARVRQQKLKYCTCLYISIQQPAVILTVISAQLLY